MSKSRVEIGTMANCLLLVAFVVVSLGAGSGANQVEEAQNDLLENKFLRQALENLEQDPLFVRSPNLSRGDRPQQQQGPRGYMVLAEVDQEGRARRADRDQLLKSSILDELIKRMMQFRRISHLEEIQAPQQQQQPIFRLARDQEEASLLGDLSIADIGSELPQVQPLGLVWDDSRDDKSREQSAPKAPSKRLSPVGIEFKAVNKANQHRYPFNIVRKQKSSRNGNDYGKDSENIDGPTNVTSGGLQNKFIKPESMSDIMDSSLEAKRVENSRWNNLRGMWGKRSL